MNGQLRHHTDSPTDVPASHREDINGSQASHDQGSLGNGAASSTADPSSPSHVQPGHAPQQGGDGSEPDWQPDWDRFEPFASMSSSADSVDLAEEVELTHPPSEHGPRFKVRMGSDSLPWDAEFRPHEYLSAEDVDLALSPQRMQAVTSDAQVCAAAPACVCVCVLLWAGLACASPAHKCSWVPDHGCRRSVHAR